MEPDTMKRYPVHKQSSAKSFRRNTGRTKAVNLAGPPERGGYRL